MTTFEVYPALDVYPTFEELVKQGSAGLGLYLGRVGIPAHPQITVSLHALGDNTPQRFSLSDPATWSSQTYAWFGVEGMDGGSDAYTLLLDDAARAYWADDLFQIPRYQKREALIRSCLNMDHYWVFRCEDQPVIMYAVYGFLAIALARLTGGFLYSKDGAWEADRFPAMVHEFLNWYLIPGQALTDETREWSERYVALLKEELESIR